MSIRNIVRRATALGYATPSNAPVYVDSDDNKLKMIPAGSGTTEVEVVDASSAQTLTNKTLTSPVVNLASGTQLTEVVTATRVLTAAESGRVIFLNAATEFDTKLPAPAAGLWFKFIVTAAPSGADYTITTNGTTQNVIFGHVASADLNAAGDSAIDTAGKDVISFVSAKAAIGDWVELICDGTNWYMSGSCSVFDAITLA